ncbi:hypothetical protein [Flavobacterium caeni]|uniref:CarboxypepD_reg-like domain-containing protein n=1 Tax=Flavobacterium caeni TaxID=490189 RepID=A0A1G5I618_9FLAO|nr:hypothetical protein [Flavobacterium caeni]SCY71473.1 hypothetical protein SAMN02927903_02121 [Flavobacterium caeni]
MNKLLIAFVALSMTPQSATAQQARRTLKGKVSAFANDLRGIYVINPQTEKSVLTEENGYFSIAAAVGDTLVFSSIRFKGRKVALDEQDFEKGLFVVRLEPMMQQLDEVQIVRYDHINAVSLGIIPKGQKTYTPAERKLKAGTDYEPQIGLNSSLQLDPLINALTGRGAELRKNVEVEKKERMIDKINYWYETDYFTDKLGLPEEHVKGFHFYIVENPSFVKALNDRNKTMATFIMGELAVQYKQILVDEKK